LSILPKTIKKGNNFEGDFCWGRDEEGDPRGRLLIPLLFIFSLSHGDNQMMAFLRIVD